MRSAVEAANKRYPYAPIRVLDGEEINVEEHDRMAEKLRGAFIIGTRWQAGQPSLTPLCQPCAHLAVTLCGSEQARINKLEASGALSHV